MLAFALRLSVRLCVVNLVFQAGGCQFFQWEDMMEQMLTIHVVPSPPIAIQVIPEVVVLRDRMDRIVDHLKWISKLVCVHSYCSVCSTKEVDDNASVCRCIYMMILQKYQFKLRDCSHILCHKEAGISLAKKHKTFKFIVATGR
jgi:hypothetical protein